jgi:hypothetical protein
MGEATPDESRGTGTVLPAAAEPQGEAGRGPGSMADEPRSNGGASASEFGAESAGGAPDLLVAPELRDRLCPHCPLVAPQGWPTNLQPLWLHAWRYSCDDWSFEARPPEWAAVEWCPTR